jgi:predicted RNA-binding Zn-ribbon protein involved in translation (DUF1610 family)
MKELTFLIVIILIGLAGYLLYSVGVINDMFNWISKTFEGIKLPEIKLPDVKQQKSKFDEKLRDYHKRNQEDVTNKMSDYHKKIDEKYKEYQSYDYDRSTKGDKISKDELDYLWDGISTRRRVPCINCKSADMYSGVQTGNSQYWYCPNCGQVIILSLLTNKKDGVVCYNLGIDKSKIK